MLFITNPCEGCPEIWLGCSFITIWMHIINQYEDLTFHLFTCLFFQIFGIAPNLSNITNGTDILWYPYNLSKRSCKEISLSLQFVELNPLIPNRDQQVEIKSCPSVGCNHWNSFLYIYYMPLWRCLWPWLESWAAWFGRGPPAHGGAVRTRSSFRLLLTQPFCDSVMAVKQISHERRPWTPLYHSCVDWQQSTSTESWCWRGRRTHPRCTGWTEVC